MKVAGSFTAYGGCPEHAVTFAPLHYPHVPTCRGLAALK